MDNKSIVNKIDKIIKEESIPKYYKKYKPSKKIRKEIINYSKPHDQKFCSLLDKYVKPYHYHTGFICSFPKKGSSTKKFKISSKLPKKLRERFDIARPPPEFYFDKKTKIGKIVFYKFNSSLDKKTLKKEIKLHKKSIQQFLSKHKFRGLILDLRLHNGGNMWPTVTGLKSILANVPFYILTKNDKVNKDDLYMSISEDFDVINNWEIKHIELKENKINTDYPIAIIIGPYTYSSGELISAIFAGKENVKVFGKKSGGGLSANDTIPITKNIKLKLTTVLVGLTNGQFNEFLIPDKKTNKPITEARKWILSQ